MFSCGHNCWIFNLRHSIFLVVSVATRLLLGCYTDCCRCGVTDCQDYKDMGHSTSGVYRITPCLTRFGNDVYCDMTTDGGGWLAFQRRLDGSEEFYRDWYDYERGFGNASHEYWLGFGPLIRILAQGFYELRVDLEDWNGKTKYAKYNIFNIGSSDENYKLKALSYSGDAGNALANHHGLQFTTKDNDNDGADINCAEVHQGAWWYKNCHMANLNGKYHNASGIGMVWKTWKMDNSQGSRVLKKVEMKIRKV